MVTVASGYHRARSIRDRSGDGAGRSLGVQRHRRRQQQKWKKAKTKRLGNECMDRPPGHLYGWLLKLL